MIQNLISERAINCYNVARTLLVRRGLREIVCVMQNKAVCVLESVFIEIWLTTVDGHEYT